MNKYLQDYSFNIPKIGIGLAALGRPGYINLRHGEDLQRNYSVNAMYQNARDVLNTAWQSGIRYFDAARSYGKAEEFLSNWLKEQNINKDEIIVASKWGYEYTADWKVQAEKHEIKEHSISMLQKQWPQSYQLLKDHLKLYQIHSATLDSGVLENKEVLNKLFELKQNGIKIGLTLSGANQAKTLEKAVDISIDGVQLFDSVQATYNILERSAGSTLQEASDRGLVIVIKESLANGRLTNRNKEEGSQSKLNTLKEIATTLHTSIDAVALAYVMQKPWVDIVLSGAATTTQLKSNLKALNIANKVLPDELGTLKEDPEEYWRKRKMLAWN